VTLPMRPADDEARAYLTAMPWLTGNPPETLDALMRAGVPGWSARPEGERLEAIRAAQPEAEVHIYPAGHGFNCDDRDSYHQEAAEDAQARTLAFFAEHLK